ncbi:hypothetical protein OUHCRE11_11200 [Enterobacter asburiae]
MLKPGGAALTRPTILSRLEARAGAASMGKTHYLCVVSNLIPVFNGLITASVSIPICAWIMAPSTNNMI